MRFMSTVRIALAASLVLTSSWICSAQQDSAPAAQKDGELLTIGSRAPQLDIEHWVQDGLGELGPVGKFEPGKVYVVEFWATWCGPCIGAMPHISQLQRDYLEKGVTIVSISDEDLETVTKFLERKVPNTEDQTYQELTKFYCLTTDPDRSTHEAYMEAAGQNGIPTAFLVGKKGLIEWIGHPMTIDEPLAKVVNGEWDRDAFVAEFKMQQEIEAAMGRLSLMLQNGEGDEARALVDDLLERASNAEMKAQLTNIKMAVEFNIVQTLVLDQDENAVAGFNRAITMFKDEPEVINQLSWLIVQVSEAGNEVSSDLLDAAIAAAENAMERDPENGSILDTLAHLVYAKGDVMRAIELEEKAIKVAPEAMRPSMEAFLKKLKEEG